MTDAPLLSNVDPNSITAIVDNDPYLLGAPDLDRLIAELRRRADVNASEAAAAEAAPKTTAGRRRKANPLIDAAMAALADKPVSELSLDDLMGAAPPKDAP